MNQMKTQHSIATARALNMIYDHSARARAHALKLKKILWQTASTGEAPRAKKIILLAPFSSK